MNRPDFREHFLHTGPGGATEYRQALKRTIDQFADWIESVDAPYSGLDAGSLDELLAEAKLEGALELVARHSIVVQHPRCIAHLHTPPVISALAAEVVISALNQSMDSWDQASAATHVEIQTVDWFAKRVGFGEGADGTFTGGGTQSNFMGLLLARDEVCRRVSNWDVFENGLPDYAGRLRVLTSKTAHFSVVKSLAQLGLGARAVVAVDCDAQGRMKPAALEEALAEIDQQLLIPMAVAATAGTTDHGAIDPLDEIARICQARQIWLHVDAAYGGGLILTEQRARLGGIERADSVTLDFHKFFYQPISCGLFLLRDGSRFRHIEHHADYLNREADPRPNLVEKSVATSRRFDALKIWLTLKSIGPETLGRMVERTMNLAGHAAQTIAADPKFQLFAEPQLSTVLFRFGASDELNRDLHEQLLASGRAIIGRTVIDGTVALKLTVLNPCLTESDLDELIELIRAEGNRLETNKKSATA